MKLALLFISCLFSYAVVADNLPLREVRALYEKSAENEADCKKMIELLSGYEVKDNALFYGYRACATALMAKHVFNPLSKLSYFNDGKRMLEEAIAVDRNNVELRYLRYTVQTNAPSFLNYNDQISVDREYLVKSLPSISDQELKQRISAYLNEQNG